MHTAHDQVTAAVAEARTAVTTALGLPADHQPTKGSSPFLNELLDTHCRPDTPRCRHLTARPVQVWMMALPYPRWRCRPCMAEFGQTQRARQLATGHNLGHTEEHTCDRCRRYLPGQRLTPAVLRQDLWVLIGSLCADCTAYGQRHGVQLTGPVS